MTLAFTRRMMEVVVLLELACAVARAQCFQPQDDLSIPCPSWSGPSNERSELSPTALATTADGALLFIACATANQILIFDTIEERTTAGIAVPESPLGLVLSKDDSRLYVACAAPASKICILDVKQRRVTGQIDAGHTAMAPVLSPDERWLYVCNRFDNDVSVIDLETRREVQRIRVEREPVAQGLTPDGRWLIVANHLHAGSANDLHASAMVSVIDTTTRSVARKIPLTFGASLLRGVAVSPDGRFAAVTHLRSMFWLTTSGVDLGRINGNALSILDLRSLRVLGTLLLDQSGRGAANPWAVAWTADGKTMAVSQAGTHDVSLIDAPVDSDPSNFVSMRLSEYADKRSATMEPPKHPVRVRQRLPLPGNGPRALALAGSHLFVANYFSDSICRIDLETKSPAVESFALGPASQPGPVREGEMLFNDGRLCSQGWQSCASCHDPDARTDALNWDLLNDGAGNPKNTKSLVWAHQTAPAMALGVRDNAQTAVRAGIHHILFTSQPEEVPAAIDAYLQSLEPMSSPHLACGRLSEAAQRGEKLFLSSRTGCADCHPPPLFTDLATHDVGTATGYRSMWGSQVSDGSSAKFDTPALAELWRTAPYLHDGGAVTLRQMLTELNPGDRHGKTSELSTSEVDDLIQFLLSL